MKDICQKIILLLLVALLIISCQSKAPRVKPTPPRPSAKSLQLMGYTIQAGAFANVQNAVRLTETLKDQGLDATYFLARDGLFKVRFGNFATKEMARQRAQRLRDSGVIEEFYIVQPEDYAVAKRKRYGTYYLRNALVKTAREFIGVPYLWGGTSPESGFDCSGLTMTVYQLNGLNLPRHSATQYDAGNPIDKQNLQKGDLVFFATNGNGKVSHVGIYIGNDRFIHAPSRGKNIRIESMSCNFFAKRYLGARTYM
ncbi:MAG: hydrolase [Syntrophaceae bacterium]|nr:hydrolase [Syntrophaceae bacterium]